MLYELCYMNYAPVLISVYDRVEHFNRCLNSLKQCKGANKTHLFIAIDYPKKEEILEKYHQIIEIAKSTKGFKEITLFIRDTNLGSKENIYSAINEIYKCYDRLIFSEDDNEFSTGFLLFMNNALEIYSDDQNIFAINGYNYPIEIDDIKSGDVYRFKGYCAWGAGIWRDKWLKIDWSFNNLKKFVHNPINLIITYKIAPSYNQHFISSLLSKEFAGDVYIVLNLIKNNWYTINPVHTLVRNYGCDKSGEHKSSDLRFINQNISLTQPDPSKFVNQEDLKILYKRLRKYFCFNTYGFIKFIIKYIYSNYINK